jgi:hypothetical protein
MSRTICEPSLTERIKVCPNCKCFIFKDDTVDFCAGCFHRIEPDLDIVIINDPQVSDPPKTWLQYLLSWI